MLGILKPYERQEDLTIAKVKYQKETSSLALCVCVCVHMRTHLCLFLSLCNFAFPINTLDKEK